jgi:hypothetical protein
MNAQAQLPSLVIPLTWSVMRKGPSWVGTTSSPTDVMGGFPESFFEFSQRDSVQTPFNSRCDLRTLVNFEVRKQSISLNRNKPKKNQTKYIKIKVVAKCPVWETAARASRPVASRSARSVSVGRVRSASGAPSVGGPSALSIRRAECRRAECAQHPARRVSAGRVRSASGAPSALSIRRRRWRPARPPATLHVRRRRESSSSS